MKPIEKLNGLAVTITVMLMLPVVGWIVPLAQKQSESHAFLLPVIALLTTAGTYRVLSISIGAVISCDERLRALVLGPSYMHGTWVGWFRGHTGELRFMIEHFVQDFDSLVITGRSFTESGDTHGYWSSDAVSINSKKGELMFTYVFDVISNKASTSGVHRSLFERRSARKPPTGLAGFAHDLNDPTRIAVTSKKVSSELLRWEDALSQARTIFTNR
jgi:hypothetical protein